MFSISTEEILSKFTSCKLQVDDSSSNQQVEKNGTVLVGADTLYFCNNDSIVFQIPWQRVVFHALSKGDEYCSSPHIFAVVNESSVDEMGDELTSELRIGFSETESNETPQTIQKMFDAFTLAVQMNPDEEQERDMMEGGVGEGWEPMYVAPSSDQEEQQSDEQEQDKSEAPRKFFRTSDN